MTENEDAPATALERIGEGLTGLVGGVPLPPVVQRSFWRAISSLITGAVEVPAAWFAAKAQGIRDEAAARTAITEQAVEVVSRTISNDPELARRATMNLASRLLREQRNRESVAFQAAEELRKNPPDADAKSEVDEDWLGMFARVAEQRGAEDVQRYLGRLLAGEIRSPGSFSPATVQVLATLTPRVTITFQKFCDISLVFSIMEANAPAALPPMVLAEPFGAPGANSLTEFGLSYSALTTLQDAGLVKSDLTAWHDLPAVLFATPLRIGGVELLFRPTSDDWDATVRPRCKVVHFTDSGAELRRIMTLGEDATFVRSTEIWIERTFSLARAESPPPQGQPGASPGLPED